MKLNATQLAVLRMAASKTEIDYHAVARDTGANGRTLTALEVRALLVKHQYPDGSNVWRITNTGRTALEAA